MPYGAFRLSGLPQSRGEIVVCLGTLRPEFQRPPIQYDRFLDLPTSVEQNRELELRTCVVRQTGGCPPAISQGLPAPAQPRKQHAEPPTGPAHHGAQPRATPAN